MKAWLHSSSVAPEPIAPPHLGEASLWAEGNALLVRDLLNARLRACLPSKGDFNVKEIDIINGKFTLLLALDEQLHFVTFDKGQYAVLEQLLKRSIHTIVPAHKTQLELNEFLNYKQKEEMLDE